MSQVIDGFTDLLNEKIIQVSLIGGILFYILATPEIFAFMENVLKKLGSMFNININLTGRNLLIFHSVVFSIFMGISVKYVFEPIFYQGNGLFK